MDEVMEWVETVIMEPEKMRLYFDITKSRVIFENDNLLVTTTKRTTDLVRVIFYE
jgi:hypothetical protein